MRPECRRVRSTTWSRFGTDEQVQAREMDVTLEHPLVGTTRNIGLAAKLYGSPGRIHSPAPLMGQHTREVLAETGFSDAEIEGLIASGAAQAV